VAQGGGSLGLVMPERGHRAVEARLVGVASQCQEEAIAIVEAAIPTTDAAIRRQGARLVGGGIEAGARLSHPQSRGAPE